MALALELTEAGFGVQRAPHNSEGAFRKGVSGWSVQTIDLG
jgi:hypothetical protein